MALGIRKGDLVRVTKGADRGKTGRVMAVDPERGRVRIEKVRVQKHHLKAGRRGQRTGGIVEQEGFIDASNIQLVDAKGKAESRPRRDPGRSSCARLRDDRRARARTRGELNEDSMAKRGKREIIKLESSAGTGHFYTTVKNRQNTPNKLEIKKYDPVVRKHVVYKETKLR